MSARLVRAGLPTARAISAQWRADRSRPARNPPVVWSCFRVGNRSSMFGFRNGGDDSEQSSRHDGTNKRAAACRNGRVALARHRSRHDLALRHFRDRVRRAARGGQIVDREDRGRRRRMDARRPRALAGGALRARWSSSSSSRRRSETSFATSRKWPRRSRRGT